MDGIRESFKEVAVRAYVGAFPGQSRNIIGRALLRVFHGSTSPLWQLSVNLRTVRTSTVTR